MHDHGLYLGCSSFHLAELLNNLHLHIHKHSLEQPAMQSVKQFDLPHTSFGLMVMMGSPSLELNMEENRRPNRKMRHETTFTDISPMASLNLSSVFSSVVALFQMLLRRVMLLESTEKST
ncbi:hypothetical protein C4D60_Mb04t07600 [Musa balbisiana]|uniref:Uncharacterized protein n=1 Tax=Musa balbisiana TaxID=52838 RepID=A0A4S8KAC2_MUSBA|nr:hypothetical protein C4D60_Mb04t07600 [Musa balbisiana]